MIRQRARIVAEEGAFAWVEPCQPDCLVCGRGRVCQMATFSALLFGGKPRIKAYNGPGAEVGEQVLIGVDEGPVLSASFAVYLVPILSMLAGAMLGHFLIGLFDLDGLEAVPVLFSGCGLVGGYLWLRRFAMRRIKNQSSEVLVLSCARK
ncbi:MAG: SoxR reducing system RseC family protein [Gammaproteobacteria bacterium]|nr:SoxR reducing system RseC family protein [Gammaproteobacteria bacterium]MCI0590950.1 SoxR reducing system RseC family protein [Gammaproteobacteria bacterium]